MGRNNWSGFPVSLGMRPFEPGFPIEWEVWAHLKDGWRVVANLPFERDAIERRRHYNPGVEYHERVHLSPWIWTESRGGEWIA